ncbi:hypothetical protein Tco_0675964 [Tanacetum coccineum]
MFMPPSLSPRTINTDRRPSPITTVRHSRRHHQPPRHHKPPPQYDDVTPSNTYSVQAPSEGVTARVLDVVTAKSNSTLVITIQRDFIEVKSVVFELLSHPKDLSTTSRHAMYCHLCS